MATATLSPGDLLTRREAAELLGVKYQTLCLWASVGRYALPFVRVGRLVKYRRSDLEAWLSRRAVGTVGGDSE